MVCIMCIIDICSVWGEDLFLCIWCLVSNVCVFGIDKVDEYKVLSYLLVICSCFDFDDFDLIFCECYDILCCENGQLKLVWCEILLDQVVIGILNFGIFF